MIFLIIIYAYNEDMTAIKNNFEENTIKDANSIESKNSHHNLHLSEQEAPCFP
jgi:hypothetical protein